MILVALGTGVIGKVISSSLHTYVESPNWSSCDPGHQFECNVVLDFELYSKLDSGIPNWIGLHLEFDALVGPPRLLNSLQHPLHHLHGL
jgi:hypothetical protein